MKGKLMITWMNVALIIAFIYIFSSYIIQDCPPAFETEKFICSAEFSDTLTNAHPAHESWF